MQDKQKKWCKRIVEKWRSKLFLGEWFFYFNFMEEDLEDEDGQGRPAAEVVVSPMYMKATIKVYPCFWNSSPSDREHYLVHEMSHCHTQKLWDIVGEMQNGRYTNPQEVRYHVEQLTQRIANIAFQQEWKK